MVEVPENTVLLSSTEIGDTWVDVRRQWAIGIFQIILGAISLEILSLILGFGSALVPVAVLTLALLSWRYQLIKKKQSELDFIAISSGHPWNQSEDVEGAAVFVLDQGEQWIALDNDVRIATTNDPLLNRILLRDGDSEGAILARCDLFPYMFPDVIKIINMAQALASAQNREEGVDDEFEAAREREKTAEGVLEREWLDTEEGSMEYEPGALLRAFKKSKDGAKED